MSKCKNCNNLYNLSNEQDEIVGKWCPKTNDSPDLERERECEHFKAKTNADRIRSMTDEELAKFLEAITCESHGWCEECQSLRGDYCHGLNDPANFLVEEKLKWLKKEVEEA